MKTLFALSLLALSACGTPQTDSYSLGRGVATYDELARATEACRARGGTIKAPRGDNGGDPTQLSNYTCVIAKGN